MRFHWLWLTAPILVAVSIASLAYTRISSPPLSAIPLRKPSEPAPMCPWREPARDLKTFFGPHATYRTDLVILSDQLVPLKARLGRWPSADENPIYVHRVLHNEQAKGSILVRRIKGEYGAIEVVMAVDAQNRVRGVRVQRWREPQAITKVLSSATWLHRFNGKSSRSDFQVLRSDLPPAARASGRAIIEGVRVGLILLDAGATARHQSTLSAGTTRQHR